MRYNKLLEEQKFLPKLIPLLKPIDNDYFNTSSSEFMNESYDDDLAKSYDNYVKEKKYNKKYNNNYRKYNDRNYYNNNRNYFRNNNNYDNNYYKGYNSNMPINNTFHRDFEEFQMFRQFINLKYAPPLYYKNM